MYREQVLEFYHDGFINRQIAREICLSPGFVQKVIDHDNEQNTSFRGIRVGFPSPKMDEQVVEYIEVQKLMKLSTYSTQLQQRLLLDGVVHPANLPSVSQINKVICKELIMTRKKLTTIPLESTTPEATTAINDFLTEIANINPMTLHFFDYFSAIKTTGNRNYGSAPLGQAAFEIQRYLSNATFTINLLHSFSGIHFYNILDGPSNGFKQSSFH
ncbi:paired box protein Pax-8-like [Orbicella faveolata]|uniref:paired box protein Pax-8-like n=1 Tax=Orbicella faveolata TaxID=48498 RepID=UPI0009E5B028|nr:paired box protein Pax-8-like [Orbicella faveolata]